MASLTASTIDGDDIPEIIKLVNENDIDGVKLLLLTGRNKIDETDRSGMTPLQHAAYKSQLEMCKLLLEHGADVNADTHDHNYSALHFGALSGNVELTKLLLEAGAKTHHVTSLNRNAAQMAAFVGNHVVVSVINNFIEREDVKYYTQIHGLEKSPKLPPDAEESVYELIMQSNLHPVYILKTIRKNNILKENLANVRTVLKLLCEKEATRRYSVNEVLALKYHYIGHVVSTLIKEINDKTSGDKEKAFDNLIKKLLRARESDGIEDVLDYFVTESVKTFHYVDMPLFQQLMRNLMGDVTERGSLNTLNGCINGQRAFPDDKICSTCGIESKDLKSCSKCKISQYCNRECQKMHWPNHKKVCDKLGNELSKLNLKDEK